MVIKGELKTNLNNLDGKVVMVDSVIIGGNRVDVTKGDYDYKGGTVYFELFEFTKKLEVDDFEGEELDSILVYYVEEESERTPKNANVKILDMYIEHNGKTVDIKTKYAQVDIFN